MIVVCVKCGYYTTTLEANARRFNQGRCGYCGGELVPAKPRELKEVK